MSRTDDAHNSPRRWPAIVACAALIAVSLAAGASAQLDTEGVDPRADTVVTPVAKKTDAWARVAGAKFGEDAYPADSPTPVEVELYSVAFETNTHGFAAGMRCKVAPPSGLSGDALDSYLADCGGAGREPVIYEYVKTETGESWHSVLPSGGTGYVGAIAFLPDGRALAVGGTGEYPKRESTSATSAATDPAGDARAWIYDDGFWTELEAPQMAPGMRGLTAVGAAPDVAGCTDALSDCALAGGYRQLWMWKDGEFATGWGTTGKGADEEPLSGTLDDLDSFRFRVRQVAFLPDTESPTKAVAITSGCCDAIPSRNVASGLIFDGKDVFVKEYSAPATNTTQDPAPGVDAPGDDPAVRRDVPDSLYGIVFSPNGASLSIVATPGGPASPAAGDRPSRVYGNISTPDPGGGLTKFTGGFEPSRTSSAPNELPNQALSSLRLMAGAGAQRGIETQTHVLDWAVGSLASGEGIAYNAEGDDGPNGTRINVLTCGSGPFPFGGGFNFSPDLQCKPYDAPGGYVGQTASKIVFRLPTYGLNAMAFTDETETTAWAVGDRGAIVRFGGVAATGPAAGSEEEPKLGAGTLATFQGNDVYASFRPLPVVGDPAPVPSLAASGTHEVERPELVSGGAPNPAAPGGYPSEDVTSVVMSRDGSEGWAVGAGSPEFQVTSAAGPSAPTVYHYDGIRWSRCDTRGVSGALPPDPACAKLNELWDQPSGSLRHIVLRTAVRVPLENDDDPSNDDQFEVFAVGSGVTVDGKLTRAAFRYRGGEWSVDHETQKQWAAFPSPPNVITGIAFTAPNDGWVATDDKGARITLLHWDGETWVDCETAPVECGDEAGRLPLTTNSNGGWLTTAGRRLYLFANRRQPSDATGLTSTYPVILYKDQGGQWTSEDGGHDPLCSTCTAPPAEQQGTITAGVVTPDHEHGWAVGQLGTDPAQSAASNLTPDATPKEVRGARYYLLRLVEGKWVPYRTSDASADYLARPPEDRSVTPVFLDPESGAAALYALDRGGSLLGPGFLVFDPARGETGRWRVLQTPFHMRSDSEHPSGAMARAFVPDQRGGAWLAAKQATSFGDEQEAVHFWRYTRDVPNQVFEEAPHPIRERITGGTAGPDGSFWVTTNSGFVYRYDRVLGWDRLRVPGWDPGRVVTRTSEAYALAVGTDGEGLVVGKNGRLAQVSPLGVQLDPAAGKLCNSEAQPCGTSRDLHAVDIAPDGSALAGGDGGALLYRPAGGAFRALGFEGSGGARITDISMPAPDRAWLTTTVGQVYAGTLTAEGWTFKVENRGPTGQLLSFDEENALLRLHAVDVDEDGEGYAVGQHGLVLERHADGSWGRLNTGFMDTLRSIALSPQGRDGGALIGGDMGLILTLEDGDFRVSREADLFNPVNFGDGPSHAASVRGVAMVPGLAGGEVEAWAVQQVTAQSAGRPGPGTVLHYSSNGDDPLLRPGSRVEPLPDAPAPRDGEISFAAFGRSECNDPGPRCPEGHAGNLFHEVLARRVADSVIARSKESGGPGFAIFTGDVGRAAGSETGASGSGPHSSLDNSRVHRRWKELVADRFADAQLPLFGAVGLNDLDRTALCMGGGSCPVNSKEHAAGAGLAFGWRKAMADLGWGANRAEGASGLVFEPVPEEGSQPVEGEARTHYALDVLRGSRKIARLIVLDNSMRTLGSSDPNQNPVEPEGQLAWLDRMLAGVDRAGGQQAIAVMNTPTYSYAAGDPTTWAADAAEIERRLMANDAKMLVSGRLGWNGRFWATAPGVHHPCPEGAYVHDDSAPDPSKAPCADQTAAADDVASRVGGRLAESMQGLGAPAPPGEDDIAELTTVTDDATGLVQGLLPQVVAASAGGPFGPNGNEGGPASSGWWHGYTIVRMDKSGDPRKTIVEQRPIFDWVSITGATHVLKPRQKTTLIGEGREPLGADVPPRYDRINSDAITHRYDLVLADEKNPAMPRRTESGGYVEVPESVGTINRETGTVTAKNGRQERTYAVAILSVGDKAATWPIAFEPAKSFKPQPVPEARRSVVNTPARPAPVRPLPPPPVVLNTPPSPTPPPPPPANIPQVTLPTLKLPTPPALPNIPSLPASTPTATPPPPAPPPPPPGNAGALPLTLQAPLTAISVVTTVIPPSPPPINPAPPGGSAARKEARQRQAATAKSEEGGGGDQGAGESSGESGSSEMTRRDRTRPAPSFEPYRPDDTRYSFTAVSRGEQASAWSRGALYGGMTIASALVLALGWGTVRPGPKRRQTPRPAPQTVRERRRY